MDGFQACSSSSAAGPQPLRKTKSVRSTLAAPARRFLQGFLRWWQLEMLRGIRRRIATAAAAVTRRWLKAEDVRTDVRLGRGQRCSPLPLSIYFELSEGSR